MNLSLKASTILILTFALRFVNAEDLKIGECVKPLEEIQACSKENGIHYLSDNDPLCELAKLDLRHTPSIIRASGDALNKLPVCILSGGETVEDSFRLLGRFVDSSHPIVKIQVNSISADQVTQQNQSSVITFAARRQSDVWITFGDTSSQRRHSDQQTAVLENVNETVDVALPLNFLNNIGPSIPDDISVKGNIVTASVENNKLNISLGSTKGISKLNIPVQNSFGEETVLTVILEHGYFVVDRSLAKKSTDLAHLYKLQADETYLRASGICSGEIEDVDCRPYTDADELYVKAANEIPDCPGDGEGRSDQEQESEPGTDPCNDESLTRTWELLRSDIAYRRKLIRFNLPFYGGFRSLTPTTPYHELIKMEALLEDLTELLERIDKFRHRYSTGSINAAVIQAEKAYALGEYDASEIDQRIGQIERDYASLDFDSYNNRQDVLENEIRQFQNKLDELGKEQDALGTQASALTKAGIAAATGIPITDVNAIASGDLKSVAESFVKQQVLSEGTVLANDFIAQSEIAKGIADTISEVRDSADRLKDLDQQAEMVKKAIKGDKDAIRLLVSKHGTQDTKKFLAKAQELEIQVERAIAMSKSLDRKRAIEFLKANLTRDEIKEIDRLVEEIKPIERVLETAYVSLMEGNFEEKLLNEFEDQLTGIIDQARPSNKRISEMKAEIKLLVRQDPSTLTDPYFGRLVIKAIDTFGANSKNIVRAVMTFDPNLITDVRQVRKVLNKLNPEDRAKVQQALRAVEPSISRNVSMTNGQVCFTVRKSTPCIDFEEIRRGFKRKYQKATAFPIDRMNDFIEQQIDDLPNAGVILIYIARDGAGGFSGNVRDLFDGNEARLKRAWDGVDNSGALFSKDAVRESGRVAVAELLTAAQLPKAQPTQRKKTPASSLPQSSEDLDPATNMAMQAALNAALPGAGIALQLGQVWASMDANRELMDDYTKRLSAAIREQDQLVRSKQLATRTAALAELQRQRATAVRRAGEQQIAQFEVALSANMDEKKFNRELMSLYRPRFYYIAEALREKFEAFDRSLADWSEGIPQSGFFKEKILEDPRNARLALDSEIQLFGWLNRNIEATRTGPYVLHHHWERLVGLARDYCSDFGCKPGDGSLGQIGQTVPQLFFENIQGRLSQREFFHWRDSADREDSFSLSFSFAPGQLGITKDALNARLLDFSVIPVDQNGRPLPGNRVELQHDGISTLVLKDPDGDRESLTRKIRHVLLPRKMLAPNREESEDVESLRRRFQDQVDVNSLLRLRDLEGYGLYGNFQLAVISGPDVERIHDFRIQLSFIYNNPENINSEFDFVALFEDKECKKDASEGGKVLTGMFCHSDGIARYKLAKIRSNGKIDCSDYVIAEVKLRNQNQVDYFSSLGHVQCLEYISDPDDTDPTGSDLILDPSLIRQKTNCRENEVLLLASHSVDGVNCFGGRHQ